MNLESSWVLWQNGNDDSNIRSWGEDILEVGEVSTVPEFLYMCDMIVKNGVENLCSMNLFKKGIKPMWEDEANVNGGRLILDIPMMTREDLNGIWKKTMAFCVSNCIENICGCVFNEKQSVYKISIWFGRDYNQDMIKEKWESVLGNINLPIYSFLHKKSLDGTKGGKKKWGGKREK
ncbi:translation initiation factor 4E [Ordospora colligata]|uniref:Translation initiation factor 4E n=1 Tax=Ordospora colligata OC4 TaxID=1354746 RepID=A0A0B2UJD4_9MICR|nr:translation initiation factor 4E [Ordospora colligata OC4]KHN69162.1 translation initiation factor 4E [Ordospora colligata OC4]TBU14617.1 translation initiation factor 4E [Ordospora colligata]TBU14811.1 translation initiation factor 4E [Ordospora colligata]TBU18134.1 translation initiation factor 4E [Ordospora colligata]